MGSLAFTAPAVLLALLALPALWWLLRVTPPAPRRVAFPAVRLLFGLGARHEESARTPWWILLLRLVVAALAIVGLAHPVVGGGRALNGNNALVLAIDDGWAAARDWEARKAAVDTVLRQAERQGRPVALLTTAPPDDGSPIAMSRLGPVGEARAVVQALKPKPWPVDRGAAATALWAVDLGLPARAVWLSDGIDDGKAEAFTAALQRFGALEVLVADGGPPARLVGPPSSEGGGLAVKVSRAVGGDVPAPDEVAWLRAMDDAGRVLARERVAFKAGEGEAATALPLPPELVTRLSRLDLEGVASPGAVVLLDDRWGRRPVGLVSGSPLKADLPLLSDLYYLERALSPVADIRRGGVRELLRRDLSMLVLADIGRLGAPEAEDVGRWVSGGGVLVRFAGPSLSPESDGLWPVRLRAGERVTGGALTWDKPLTLAPFDSGTPFAGLSIPPDVRVSAQVLAEPAADLAARTWARLSDGTPLVTAERRGGGWVVLVHTTANTDWSNLAMSGLFVDMLERLLALTRGIVGDEGSPPLPPLEVLDGFGRLVSPPGNVRPIVGTAIAATAVGPMHPPGFYGSTKARRALNLSSSVKTLAPIGGLPPGVARHHFGEVAHETDLKPWALATALALAVVDMVVAMALGGVLGRRGATAALAALLAMGSASAMAETAKAQPRTGPDAFALEAALETRLAYVRTGDAQVDEISRIGLTSLTEVLAGRSAVVLAEPMGVDVESDTLLFFPVLYWPVTPAQAPLSAAAGAKVGDYMMHGGMILFDTRDADALPTAGGGGAASRDVLRTLLKTVDIPPLGETPADHVLTRAFYLLKDFPGRVAGGAVWVARNPEGNDSVSPVVIGGNDWAGAWAGGGRDGSHPLFPVVPGGERQRELAFRFGINVVMYALTGNYKSDQVHLPAILERLTQ